MIIRGHLHTGGHRLGGHSIKSGHSVQESHWILLRLFQNCLIALKHICVLLFLAIQWYKSYVVKKFISMLFTYFWGVLFPPLSLILCSGVQQTTSLKPQHYSFSPACPSLPHGHWRRWSPRLSTHWMLPQPMLRPQVWRTFCDKLSWCCSKS